MEAASSQAQQPPPSPVQHVPLSQNLVQQQHHLQLHHELLYKFTSPAHPPVVHYEMLQLQGDSCWLPAALLLDSGADLGICE